MRVFSARRWHSRRALTSITALEHAWTFDDLDNGGYLRELIQIRSCDAADKLMMSWGKRSGNHSLAYRRCEPVYIALGLLPAFDSCVGPCREANRCSSRVPGITSK